MAEGLNVPTCVLKVNTQCCEACPLKVKKRLQKINDYIGVEAVDIDTKNGLVSVRGNVQPSLLIQTISEKFGKEAELFAYEKDLDPNNININIPNKTLDQAKKRSSACKDDVKNQPYCTTGQSDLAARDKALLHQVNGFIPDLTEFGKLQNLPPQQQRQYLKKKHGLAGWFGKKSKGEQAVLGCKFGGPGASLLGYARLPPPPPVLPLPPPPPRPPYRYGHYTPAYPPRSPPFRITKPSKPYPYDFYEKKIAPVGNSAFHSFRDDNVNACTIM